VLGNLDWVDFDPQDAEYPASVLATVRRPAKLQVGGNANLLRQPAVSICGSRAATESAIRYAKDFGAMAALAGLVVISGHAKGVDRAAHFGAMEAGGGTIAVLPEGASHFRPATELREVINTSNFAAISPFPADASWAVFRAMNRNRYIVALSSGLFVVESSEKGGTIEAGLECLRQRKRLLVIEYAREGGSPRGNQLLIERGGQPVRTPRELKRILSELPRDTSLSARLAL
jgi:DNA processing protein